MNNNIIVIEGLDGLGKTFLFNRLKYDLRRNDDYVFYDNNFNFYRNLNNFYSKILDRQTLHTLERVQANRDINYLYCNKTIIFDRYTLSGFIYNRYNSVENFTEKLYEEYDEFVENEYKLGIKIPSVYIILRGNTNYVTGYLRQVLKNRGDSDYDRFSKEDLLKLHMFYIYMTKHIMTKSNTIVLNITEKTNCTSTNNFKKIKNLLKL